MQREFEFPRKPNRPTNYFNSDFMQVVWLAAGEGELDQRTVGFLNFLVQREHQLYYARFPRFHDRQLAEAAALPKSTMNDVRQRAIDAGWLITRPTPRGTEYEVTIPPTYRGRHERPAAVTEPVRPDSDQNPTRIRPESDQNPTILYPYSQPSPPPPDPWGVVAKRLREAGVIQATKATEIARQNALSPEQVQSWIDFVTDAARSGDYGPGVLVKRISNPDARSFPAEYGWPPANPQGKQHRERMQREERERRETEDRKRKSAEDAAAVQRRKERATQLELRFGAELDALPIESQLELIADDFHRRRLGTQLREHGRADGMMRLELLAALAARYAEN